VIYVPRPDGQRLAPGMWSSTGKRTVRTGNGSSQPSNRKEIDERTQKFGRGERGQWKSAELLRGMFKTSY
jgi:hypothetical protein